MNIDERLEKLAERHEAFTQSVELQGHHIDQVMEAIARLLHIAEIHEHRIDRLESGDD